MAIATGKTPVWALVVIVVAAVIAWLLAAEIDSIWMAWLVAGIVMGVAVLIIWLIRELLHRRSADR